MAIRPVHRIKHVVDIQGGGTVAATVVGTLVTTVDAPVLANTAEVETGSKINGIYLKVEAVPTSAAAISNLYLTIIKNPGGNLGAISPNGVGADNDKRYVIHQEMVMLEGQVNGNPRVVFNGVIAIPRGYRRNGPNDLLQVNLKSTGVTYNYCMQAHYKEFR